MAKQKISKWSVVILIAILCLQVVFMGYFGNLKQGFHEDEIATFTLSNYGQGFYHRTSELENTWVDGDILKDTLSASGEEKFNYKMVYENQESDVHPPMYYFIIHTLSSLFEGRFSKWIGIAPNMFFCVLSSVMVFFIARRLMKNDFVALVAVAGWALSNGAMDEATFIRMYAMFTFLTALLVYLHIKAVDQAAEGRRFSAGLLVALFLCTFAGILTQYYFAIFACFLCGLFFLYLLIARKKRNIIPYLAVEGGAVVASVLCYPTLIRHILGGYRGREAFKNLANVNNAFDNIKEVFRIISGDMFNGWAAWLILLCVALIAIAVVAKLVRVRVKKTETMPELCLKKALAGAGCCHKETMMVAGIGVAMLLYCLLISKIAPYREDRYYMCLYPLFTIVSVYVVYKACVHAFAKRIIGKIAVLLVVLAITVCGFLNQTPSYLYPESTARAEVIEKYSDKPVIVLNGAYDWYATRWLNELGRFSDIYICPYNSTLDVFKESGADKNLSDGFILYVLRYEYSDEEIIAKLQEYIPVSDYELLCGGHDRIFYCTKGE